MSQRQSNTKAVQMRKRLAQEAAQIMLDSGSRDFFAAKKKAAEHLGAIDTHNMPSNTEIEGALMAYQRIFRAKSQPEALLRLRKAALKAMKFFEDYQPRLVGSVLSGTADVHSTVVLHVFANAIEEIDMMLLRYQVPYEVFEKRVRYGADNIQNKAAYSFIANDTPIDIVVFLNDGPHHAPISPVDGRPMQRADYARVEALVNQSNVEDVLANNG